ncbi:MAG: DNA polymerase III subunit beta [Pseudomonadales bacterium]|jgi:DNA polymerase-3 subunit beta
MKFSIDRSKLLEPLQVAASVVERKQTIPVLGNLLLLVEDGQLALTGTDQELELTARTSEVRCEQAGQTTIPAKKLLDICRSLSEEAAVEFSLSDNHLNIASGRFKSHLATLPTEDFPKVQMIEPDVTIKIAADNLHNLLHKTSFAMAQQDVRYFFNGLLVELVDNKLTFVATNGQRLAISFIEDIDSGNKDRQFIIPRKGVSELLKLVPDDAGIMVELRFSNNHMQAIFDNAVLTTKLIDATYPDYGKAIPENGSKLVSGDRRELREALIRTAILSNEMYRNVRLQLESGKLEIHSNNPQQEAAEESVIVDYSGDPLEIGFSVNYLIDALSVIDGDRVQIIFGDAKSACLLVDPDEINSRYVVSPMIL